MIKAHAKAVLDAVKHVARELLIRVSPQACPPGRQTVEERGGNPCQQLEVARLPWGSGLQFAQVFGVSIGACRTRWDPDYDPPASNLANKTTKTQRSAGIRYISRYNKTNCRYGMQQSAWRQHKESPAHESEPHARVDGGGELGRLVRRLSHSEAGWGRWHLEHRCA